MADCERMDAGWSADDFSAKELRVAGSLKRFGSLRGSPRLSVPMNTEYLEQQRRNQSDEESNRRGAMAAEKIAECKLCTAIPKIVHKPR